MTTISTLPVLPSTSTDAPSSYTTKADAFLGALPTLVTQVNAVNTEIENAATASDADVALVETYKNVTTSPSTSTTSNTSITPGTSAKTFTIPPSTSFSVGMYVMVVSEAAPSANWMHGMITTHTTGGTTMTVTGDLTSNTVAEASDWRISLSGPLKYIDTNATSTTTLTPSIGEKVIITQTNKGFYPGMWVVVSEQTDPSTLWMYGAVTSYFGDTLTLNVTEISTTIASSSLWYISMSAAARGSNILGINQTYRSVTRVANTVYQNTSSTPIYLTIAVTYTGLSAVAAYLYVGTTNDPTILIDWKHESVTSFSRSSSYSVKGIIPPGYYYKIITTNFNITHSYLLR